MKLFKTYPRGIGNQVISVPTNADFLIGVKTDNELSSATLTDLASLEELSPLDEKIGSYLAFKESTGNKPFSKEYIATLTGTREETVSIMGRRFKVSAFNAGLTYFLLDFPMDDYEYWSVENHPTETINGTRCALVVSNSDGEIVNSYDLGVPTLTFSKINTGRAVVYKFVTGTYTSESGVTIGPYEGFFGFTLQFIDFDAQTLTPYPEGFVPGWDNADRTMYTDYARQYLFGYQGETVIGEETVQVPVSADYKIKVDCHKSSLGSIELG